MSVPAFISNHDDDDLPMEEPFRSIGFWADVVVRQVIVARSEDRQKTVLPIQILDPDAD
jgi:hypothetical protein